MSSVNDIARVREQWGGVIQAVVAACGGDAAVGAEVGPFLSQLEQKPDWRVLAGVLRRILADERDPLDLLRGLDETDTLIAGDVLRALGVDVPIAGQEADDDGKMVSLEDFVAMVARACRPDAPEGLKERMLAATRGMATQPGASQEIRELGRALNAVLSGEKDPDLSALPPAWAERVREMLRG